MFLRCRFKVCAAAVLWLAAAGSAMGQCRPEWLSAPPGGFIGPAGATGTVTASLLWDSDGAGPLPARLVIAGAFASVGGTAHNRLAMWDGTQWLNIGAGGMDGPVYALAEFNGNLVAAGSFSTAGGVAAQGIARFDGTQWRPLGLGIAGTGLALLAFNNQLWVGGQFETAGGLSSRAIARWTGSQWLGFGTEVAGGGSIHCLASYYGQVVAGGRFNMLAPIAYGIARWDASGWQNLQYGLTGNFPASADAIVEYNRVLYVGGHFSHSGTVDGWNLLSWSGGEWSAVGGGVGITAGAGRDAWVHALAVHQDQLWVGGAFEFANGVPAVGIARFDGAAFHAVGGGLGAPTSAVRSFGTFQESLIAGGQFTSIGGVAVGNLARWSGADWSVLEPGPTGPIYALTNLGGALGLGGQFALQASPGITAANAATLTGTVYSPLSTLNGFRGTNGPVRAVGTYTTHPVLPPELVVAGDFTAAGGMAANRIASFALGSWAPIGAGFNDTVHATLQYSGSLYATGRFTASGAAALSRIARWTGTAWQPLGGGLNGDGRALTVFNNDLIVAGHFTTANGLSVPHMARWNGTAWQSLGSASLTGGVNAVAVWSGQLVAAGGFITNSGPTMHSAMRWTGSAWARMDAGLPAPEAGFVPLALAVHDGQVYLGGEFVITDGPTDGNFPSQVYRWTGAAWVALEGELNGGVYALASAQGRLWAGGTFTIANGSFFPYLTTWDCPCYADCDWNPVTRFLNVNDFVCFQNQFAAGSPYANCDRNAAPPFLTVNDFICFQSRFAAGCR